MEMADGESGMEGDTGAAIVGAHGGQGISSVSSLGSTALGAKCSYAHLISALESEGGFRPASRVKRVTLREGFRSPDQLCESLSKSLLIS